MRLPRIKPEGRTSVYHCISRVVAGESKLDTSTKEFFRKRMWKLAQFCEVHILTYCIMSNHFHLLVRTPASVDLDDQCLLQKLIDFYGAESKNVKQFRTLMEGNSTKELAELRKSYLSRMGDVSQFLKELKEGVSKRFNHVNDRFGPLWSERFRSLLVEDQPNALDPKEIV